MLGVWSSCASVGNIIGAFMVASVLDYGYDVRCVMIFKQNIYTVFVITCK